MALWNQNTDNLLWEIFWKESARNRQKVADADYDTSKFYRCLFHTKMPILADVDADYSAHPYPKLGQCDWISTVTQLLGQDYTEKVFIVEY